MTEKIVDPLAGKTGTTALQLLRLSDDDVRQYVACWKQKQDSHRAAGRVQASWWASKSVSAGRYELTQRGLDREIGASSQRKAGLPRPAALRISQGPGRTTGTWVRDSHWGWVSLDDEDDVGSSLEDLLGGIDDGADIEIAGPGCTLDEVLAALPLPEDADDGDPHEFEVSIDSVVYGRFSGHGWFRLHDEYEDVPAHHPLVEITFSEEGGFTSGSSVTLLGEIRPGLLVRHWSFDGADWRQEIFACDPANYVDQMRSVFSRDTDLEQLAVARALARGQRLVGGR